VLSGIIDFLFAIPLWLLAVILNAWLVAVALGGLWLTRRYILPRMRLRYDDAYIAAAAVQSAMLLYGLVTALTAVGVWQRYSQVSDIVSSEATAIVSLWRDVGGYPEPLKTTSQDLLRGYTEQIIRDAWPKQRRGEIPSEGVLWMDRLQAQIFAFEPVTEGQKIVHAEILRAFNQLVQKRRQRLDSVQSGLPSVMWFVLLPGAMGCIVLFLFFQVDNARFHAILLVGLSGFLAMVLFVIVTLDRPFVGDMGIPADSYTLIFDHHMKK
jgi:hypothetical protein